MIRFFKKQKKTFTNLEEATQYVEELEKHLHALEEEMRTFQEEMRKAIVKVGVVRFNPFRELGGDQSFSVSLLNEDNNGVVLTSHYAIENQRMYAKPVRGGGSEYSLAKEEKEAIERAMHPAE